MVNLNHTGPLGNKSCRTHKHNTQLCTVEFTTILGLTQTEIVKYNTDDDLNRWVTNYKLAYCPSATHRVDSVSKAKVSDKINIA